MNQTIEIGVEHMCNLSQGVYKTAKKIATPPSQRYVAIF